MQTEAPTTVTQGFFDTIKTKMQALFAQFEFSWKTATDLAFGFVAGLVFGFLVKRYARQTIFLCILFIALLIGLDYLNLVAVDWAAIKSFLGLTSDGTLEGVIQKYFQWGKEHIAIVFAGVLGFLVGYKVG